MTNENTYPPEVLKERLENELGFKIFSKDVLLGILLKRFGKEKSEQKDFEIPDIFDEKMKAELQERNRLIKRFEIERTGFCLQNEDESVKKFFVTLNESEEYMKLKDFIKTHTEFPSMRPIQTNFDYYAEDIAEIKSKWHNGNIVVKYDTAKKISAGFMNSFKTYMAGSIISAIYSTLDYKDKPEQEMEVYTEMLDIVNKYISALGIYAPCEVSGGMKYDYDDTKFKRYNNTTMPISNSQFTGYINCVTSLPYIMDYSYNERVKQVCTNGEFISFVKG